MSIRPLIISRVFANPAWLSLELLQYFAKLDNQGETNSRQRGLRALGVFWKPTKHSVRNSNVKWDSVLASISLIRRMKGALLVGMQRPLALSNWLPVSNLKVSERAQSKL